MCVSRAAVTQCGYLFAMELRVGVGRNKYSSRRIGVAWQHPPDVVKPGEGGARDDHEGG